MSEKNPYKYNGDTLVLENTTDKNKNKSVYIESYGCAMNFSDSEIVASILSKNGYKTSNDMYKADLILVEMKSARTLLEEGSKCWKSFNHLTEKTTVIFLQSKNFLGLSRNVTL